MRVHFLNDLVDAVRHHYLCTGRFGPRGRVIPATGESWSNVIDVRVNGSYIQRQDLQHYLNSVVPLTTKVIVKELSTKEKLLCWSLKVET